MPKVGEELGFWIIHRGVKRKAIIGNVVDERVICIRSSENPSGLIFIKAKLALVWLGLNVFSFWGN